MMEQLNGTSSIALFTVTGLLAYITALASSGCEVTIIKVFKKYLTPTNSGLIDAIIYHMLCSVSLV